MPLAVICHVVSDFSPGIGGVERATQNLCAELLADARIAVLTRYYPGRLRHEVIDGVPVHRLGSGSEELTGSLTFILHSLFWLMFRLQGYSIVHVHNIDSPLLIGMLAKLLARKKLVVTLQGEQTIIQRKASALGRLRVWLMARLGDRFVAITEQSRLQFVAEGTAAERIWAIPNGIDIRHFRPPTPERKTVLRRSFGYQADERVVLYMGRLVDLKRVDLLIKAWKPFREVKSARCVIVGDGPEQARLETLVRSEALGESVDLVGFTNDVLPYYQMADIFVLPSLYEGLSVALLEAMACGLCVIVAGSPGNLDVVEPGVNGLVFPVDAAEVLKACLTEALTDVMLCRTLGQAARERIASTYSSQAVVRAHLAMYAELVDGER